MRLFLLLQSGGSLPYSPDWWLEKWDKYGVGSLIGLLVVVTLWRYTPRVIDAFLAYMKATAESNRKMGESTEKLAEMQRTSNESHARMAMTQEATAKSTAALVDLHGSLCNREEAVVSHACDLVETVTARVAPDLMPEVKRHTDALRLISHRRQKDC